MTAELEEQRDVLLRSLRDLDEEFAAGDLDEDDYRALRDDYTARAAAVLRQLDDPAQPPSTSRSNAKTGRLLAGALVLAIVAGGIGYAVAESSGERLAGDEATGELPQGNVDRITKAQAFVADGQILEAVKVYDDLLEDDPDNPVALAQRGWLLSRVDASLVDDGLAAIDRSIAIDPTYAEAHFFRGVILLRAKGEPALAAESFQLGIDAKPPTELRTILESFRDQALQAAASQPPPPTP